MFLHEEVQWQWLMVAWLWGIWAMLPTYGFSSQGAATQLHSGLVWLWLCMWNSVSVVSFWIRQCQMCHMRLCMLTCWLVAYVVLCLNMVQYTQVWLTNKKVDWTSETCRSQTLHWFITRRHTTTMNMNNYGYILFMGDDISSTSTKLRLCETLWSEKAAAGC